MTEPYVPSAALARQIREARRDLGLTQAELAEKIGCSRTTVESWETAHRTPQLRKALALQRILKIQILGLLP